MPEAQQVEEETYESTRTANEQSFEAIQRSLGYIGQDTADKVARPSTCFDHGSNSNFGCSLMCLTAKTEESDEKQIELIVQQKKRLKPSICSPPKRYILVMLNFTGLLVLYALRVNLSVAIVSMVKQPSVHQAALHVTNSSASGLLKTSNTNGSFSSINGNESQRTTKIPPLLPDSFASSQGEFDWDERTQALVLGSFFWGYVVFQLPGGRLADSIGSKWLLGGGILGTSLLTLLSPLAARLSSTAFIVCRVLEGVFEGVVIPATHASIAKWYPPTERSATSGIIYSGSFIGMVLTLPVSAILCNSHLFGGWPSVFYFSGALGILWSALWFYLIYETPQLHPTISQAELRMLLTSQNYTAGKKPAIPWRSILTSGPMLALTVTHFGQNWGFYTLLTQMPRYFKELGFDLKSNGLYSALPYLSQAVVATSAGFLCDHLYRSGHFRLGSLRKAFNSVAFAGTAACLLAIPLIGRDRLLNILLLTTALAVNGMSMAGYSCTHVDLSPNFSGTLMGITNCLSNFAGVFSPIVVGRILSVVVGDAQASDDADADVGQLSLVAWKYVFYLSAAVYLASGLIFVLFGANTVQPWNDPPLKPVSKDTLTASKYRKKLDSNCD